jgi:hypothetical protein
MEAAMTEREALEATIRAQRQAQIALLPPHLQELIFASQIAEELGAVGGYYEEPTMSMKPINPRVPRQPGMGDTAPGLGQRAYRAFSGRPSPKAGPTPKKKR